MISLEKTAWHKDLLLLSLPFSMWLMGGKKNKNLISLLLSIVLQLQDVASAVDEAYSEYSVPKRSFRKTDFTTQNEQSFSAFGKKKQLHTRRRRYEPMSENMINNNQMSLDQNFVWENQYHGSSDYQNFKHVHTKNNISLSLACTWI
ncbi:hypothetical protein ACJX0J_034709 [Zea mays]